MHLTSSAKRHRLAARAHGPRTRLQLEALEGRNLLDGGLANVLVNDPNLDQPVLVNDNGTDILFPGDTQSEAALVLGSGNRVIVAYNDTGSQVHFSGMAQAMGFSVSNDGGSRFQDRGGLPDNRYGYLADPVLARSSRTDTIFLTALTWTPEAGFVTGRINIFRSLDNGDTFEQPVDGTPGFVPGVDWQDKPWIAADNFVGPAGSGYGNVYMAWADFSYENGKSGLYFTRSTDDGVTWGPHGGTLIARGTNRDDGSVPSDAYVAVGKDHAVYVFWLDYYGLSLQMCKSTDQGVTFGDPVTVAKVQKHSKAGDLGLTDSMGRHFRADSAPQAVVNPATGDIYLIYADKPKSAQDRADIFFVQSTDGGQTWSPRLRVNDDATASDQWQPSLAVTSDGSHVGIFWYDRRLDPANNLIDRYGAIGTITGSTVAFGANFRITAVSFPPAFGQDSFVGPTYMGDYDQAAADDRFFYTTWADNRLANPNYPDHTHQPDVRLAKIPVDWSGPALARAALAISTSAGAAPAGSRAGSAAATGMAGTAPFAAKDPAAADNDTSSALTSTPTATVTPPQDTALLAGAAFFAVLHPPTGWAPPSNAFMVGPVQGLLPGWATAPWRVPFRSAEELNNLSRFFASLAQEGQEVVLAGHRFGTATWPTDGDLEAPEWDLPLGWSWAAAGRGRWG